MYRHSHWSQCQKTTQALCSFVIPHLTTQHPCVVTHQHIYACSAPPQAADFSKPAFTGPHYPAAAAASCDQNPDGDFDLAWFWRAAGMKDKPYAVRVGVLTNFADCMTAPDEHVSDRESALTVQLPVRQLCIACLCSDSHAGGHMTRDANGYVSCVPGAAQRPLCTQCSYGPHPPCHLCPLYSVRLALRAGGQRQHQ
jgi:hypothetical protein